MAGTRNPRSSKRKGRSLQRQRALDILFEADTKALLETGLIELLTERRTVSTAQQPIQDYGVTIVQTYAQWADDVDSMIEAASPSWALSRMSAVDRNLLRIGATELMYLDVDVPIVVKEISALARDFSTTKAISFTMGILNRINEIRALETSGDVVLEDVLGQDEPIVNPNQDDEANFVGDSSEIEQTPNLSQAEPASEDAAQTQQDEQDSESI